MEIDGNLWFYHKGCTGKHYLLGNPHTFPGRMYAWCPVRERSFYCSLQEIERMSEEAKYWIKGYLHGIQPDPPRDAEGDVDFEGAEYQEWIKATDMFLNTGYWNEDERKCEKCKTKLLKSQLDEICESCKAVE